MEEIYNKLTISDDLSADSKIQDRNLLALRDPVVGDPPVDSEVTAPLVHSTEHSVHRPTPKPARPPLPPPLTGHNHALQDYQMQLMLLEQQNKKRLGCARRKLENKTDRLEKGVDLPAAAGNSTAAAVMGDTEFFSPSRFVPTTRMGDEVDLKKVEMQLRDELVAAGASPSCLELLEDYTELLLRASPQPTEMMRKVQTPSRYQVLYRVSREDGVQARQDSRGWENRYSLPSFDHPEWVRGEGNAGRVQGKMPLTNFDLYLEKNKDVSFVVYRNFDSDSMNGTARAGTHDSASGGADHTPEHTSETIQPVSRDLIQAVRALLKSRKEYDELLTEFNASNELQAPYLFIYHSRKGLEEFQNSLSWAAKTQLSLLSNYVMEQYAKEYAAADDLLSQKKISPEYAHYLFKPGDVLVSRVDGQYTGYVATSWPKCRRGKGESRMQCITSPNENSLHLYDSQNSAAGTVAGKATIQVCPITAWHWEFDGNFQRQHTVLRLEFPALDDESRNATNAEKTESAGRQGKEHKLDPKGTNLSELNVFPIQYASADIIDKCRRRGKTFWKCRNRRYVSYQDSEVESIQNIVGNLSSYAERRTARLTCQYRFTSDIWLISKPTASYILACCPHPH